MAELKIDVRLSLTKGINDLIKDGVITGKISDGYYTFDELYAHRCTLFLALCKAHNYIWHSEHWNNDTKTSDIQCPVYRTKLQSDGTSYEGWFVLVLDYWIRPKQITYHLPISMWELCDFARTEDKVINYDGHTSVDVLKRLAEL